MTTATEGPVHFAIVSRYTVQKSGFGRVLLYEEFTEMTASDTLIFFFSPKW